MDWETIKKALKGFTTYALTPATVIYIAVFSTRHVEQAKTVQFDTPVQKYETISRVSRLPGESDQARAEILDSLDAIKENIFRQHQDSIDSVRDTLTKRNAVSTWRNERNIDTLKRLLKRYIEIHDQ